MTRLLSLAFTLFVVMSAAVLPASAQACGAPAAQALARVGTTCGGLTDNTACYGHNGVIATFSQPVSFNAPGSIAPLPPLQTVVTLPFNAATGEWGIAVLRLDASLPGVLPGQNTTLLLMGDAQLAAGGAAGAPMQAFTVRVGVGQPQCAGLPPSSITINGPQRANLDLTVNGAQMRLGSSVTIRRGSTPNQLRFLVTAGRLAVENGPTIPVGFAVNVNVDDAGEILLDSWEEVEVMTAEELEEWSALEDLPEDVLGEEFPLPGDAELELLAALDFDLLLGLDPYLAMALAEDWAANGITAEDLDGVVLDDLQAYLLDNLDFFDMDDDFLFAMGDSFGLTDDDLLSLADEFGLDFDPAAFDDALMDDGNDASADDSTGDEGADGTEPGDDAAGPDAGGADAGEGDGGEAGGE
jgi:hypothetical protein